MCSRDATKFCIRGGTGILVGLLLFMGAFEARKNKWALITADIRRRIPLVIADMIRRQGTNQMDNTYG